MSNNDNFVLYDNSLKKYDKDAIKASLSLEEIESLLTELESEPINNGDHLICRTICHGGDSHKLYYYENTHLFRCYTGCEKAVFDIFELICKVKNINKQYKIYYKDDKIFTREWELFDALLFVVNFFGLNSEAFKNDERIYHKDWEYLNKLDKINFNFNKENNSKAELLYYDAKILNNLPSPRILPWEREGITKDINDKSGIKYDPISNAIIIPHFDISNNLLGIRARTLIKEEEVYGKYKPAILQGKMYNHPLGYNLYNINNSYQNIKAIKKAILFEGEKATLQYASYFGFDNNISVAVCGSSFTKYQYKLLKNLDVEEIVIAFDRQYKEASYQDEEWKRWTKKLKSIYENYGSETQISYIFDKSNKLDYKDSPIDKGADLFLKLFKERIYVN